MNARPGPGGSENGMLSVMRAMALIAIAFGIAGSVIFTVRAGGRPQLVLTILFVIWTSLPFVALVWANVASTKWPALVRVALFFTTLLVTLGCLGIYSGVILPPAGSAHAFVFVMGPVAAWGVMVIVVPLAAFFSRKR
jgi:hypothetical protein